MRIMAGKHLSWAALVVGVAVGWGLRGATVASAQGKRIPNGTLTAADRKLANAEYEGKPTGKVAVYLDGETATTRSLHAGRFLLNPGAAPHPPHRHPEEELLIVTQGAGEVLCDGKTVPVRAGAMMYADPQVEHAIRNTGGKPLEFYWVKYVPKGGR